MLMRNLLLEVARLLQAVPVVGDDLERVANRAGINLFARSISPRPRPLSMWSSTPATIAGSPTPPDYITDYTSWPSLTDRTFAGRHLPPAPQGYLSNLPPHRVYHPGWPLTHEDRVTELFAREGEMRPSRSSLLFMFFAQWFTDSIFRTHPGDRRRNTSTHEVDLCEIYGLNERHTNLLRSYVGGKLRSQILETGEFPEYLCSIGPAGVPMVAPHFAGLLSESADTRAAEQVVDGLLETPALDLSAEELRDRKAKLYATGLERGNSSIGYVAISVIFLREHNRIASDLARKYPGWNDERLFQTARNINIVILLKLIVEDYINHILGVSFFRLDHAFAEEEAWYRPNWIAAEFALLYRWHSLVPDRMIVNDRILGQSDFRFNNGLLENVGVGPLIEQASRQQAGRIGLRNTPHFLLTAESMSVQMGRDFRLQSFNAYRSRFGLKPKTSYAELTTDKALQVALKERYPNIDDLEFVVGVFAEEGERGGLFGELLNHMVAYDAFTQIFTNPLLSKNVYGPETCTPYGMDLIESTSSIDALVDRNVQLPVRASLSV